MRQDDVLDILTDEYHVNGAEVTTDGVYDTLVEALTALQAFYPKANALKILDGALVEAHLK